MTKKLTAFLDSLLLLNDIDDNHWTGVCPNHDYAFEYPILSIIEEEDGTVSLVCYGGCNREEILQEAGLTEADLYDAPEPETGGKP